MNTDELKRLATRCHEGKWIDGDFTEAANPAAILELLAQRDELLAALERTMSWLASYPGGGPLRPDGPYEQARAAIANTKGKQ